MSVAALPEERARALEEQLVAAIRERLEQGVPVRLTARATMLLRGELWAKQNPAAAAVAEILARRFALVPLAGGELTAVVER
jgi:hypothetical protein